MEVAAVLKEHRVAFAIVLLVWGTIGGIQLRGAAMLKLLTWKDLSISFFMEKYFQKSDRLQNKRNFWILLSGICLLLNMKQFSFRLSSFVPFMFKMRQWKHIFLNNGWGNKYPCVEYSMAISKALHWQ